MLYEDKYGTILVAEEVEELSAWEVLDREVQSSEVNRWESI